MSTTIHNMFTQSQQYEKGKKAPIYSLHVHPDGTRLATGAQDAKVKIWNVAPMIDEDRDQDPEERRHLCTMSLHNGAVLCVKWSNGEGKYLATGSDDMIVMIWQLDRSSDAWGGSSFGSSDGPNLENWRGVKRLSGHESDVTDVAWSPENTYLASAGLDSKIIIWDGRSFDRVITLDQHQGFVKGLTWDPVGKYMASQSDDKSVRIWRITDWESEVEITEPFLQSSGTTFFRRLSWSPDGGHIATANAFNGSIPVASVITRDNWKADISLVGHGAPVEVVAFNPLLFKYTESSGDVGFTSICAVGSQDRGITVWRTHEPRPFVGVKELFDHSFLDLSWTPDGQSLFACSYDGTVAVLLFQSENLGEAVPAEERHRLLAKYGYERRGEIMAETPIQLAMEEQLKENSVKSRMDELMQQDSSMDGVTYAFAKPSDPSVFVNATNGTAPETSSSVATEATEAKKTTDATEAAEAAAALAIPKPVVPTPRVQPHIVASEQSISVTSDGKKRIKPLFLGNGMGPVSSTPQIKSYSTGGRAADMAKRVERGEPSMALPDGGFPTVVVGTKRKDAPTNGLSATGGPTKKGPDTSSKNRLGAQKGEEEVVSRAAIASPLLAVSKVRLGVPRVRSHITRNKAGLECHNSIAGEQPSKVIYSQKGSVIWVDYLPSAVLLMTGNSLFSAVACEDGGVYVYSPAGKRLIPCIMLDSAATLMECDGEYLMVLASCGLVSSWNVIQQTAVLSSVSISPILQPTAYAADQASSSVSITSATVRQNGLPILTTSAGQGYTYHEGMKTWVKVIDPWFAISNFYGTGPVQRDSFGDITPSLPHRKGILSHIQAAASGGRLEKDAAFAQELLNVEQSVQSVVTLSHLENQLAAAQVLGSQSEYKQWLRCYAQKLADESSVARVEELCKFLLGPVYQGTMPYIKFESATYEWSRNCPLDMKKDVEAFFISADFLDRPNVFFKAFDDKTKCVALISLEGAANTRNMLQKKFEYNFMELHEDRGTTFSQITPAPRMSDHIALRKFTRDIEKVNKAARNKARVRGWTVVLDQAAAMIAAAPQANVTKIAEETGGTSSSESTLSEYLAVLKPHERSAASTGMWFIAVDIESYERDHSRILEIGWTILDSGINKLVDRHYAISDFQHLKNGKFVANRRDLFQFGDTVWAPLKESIAAFQRDLDTASKRNAEGLFALIAHDMTSDETYLKGMGVVFPEGMIKFDTLNLNCARVGDTVKTGLGKLLDELNIENYSLHNA
ncbi:HIR complex subunit, partial [Haplosporangium sp. Z 27]